MWMMIASSFIVPVLMFVCGCMFKRRAPKKINCIFGYRTSTSMINKETWEYAHACFGKIWYMCGVVFFFISMGAMIFSYIINKEIIEIISITLIVVHCIAIFVSIFAVEQKLKLNFDKEGKRI
ncbi:MAG: SdpI family protein [Clostridiales bacterium]|nr:SdpI family protein [Clostridiales bacterium]